MKNKTVENYLKHINVKKDNDNRKVTARTPLGHFVLKIYAILERGDLVEWLEFRDKFKEWYGKKNGE